MHDDGWFENYGIDPIQNYRFLKVISLKIIWIVSQGTSETLLNRLERTLAGRSDAAANGEETLEDNGIGMIFNRYFSFDIHKIESST